MNRLRTATLSILITLAFAAANPVLAQDKVGTRAIAGDKGNAIPLPPAAKVSAGVTATPPPAAVPPTAEACKVNVIGYFSSKITTKSAQLRHHQAALDMKHAKKPISEGGLGVSGGFLDIETEIGWKDFVINCPDGEAEAEAYRPLLRRGGIFVCLTDYDGKLWSYGPVYLNEALDGFAEISQLKSEHQRRFPSKYASADSAASAATKPPPQ